MRIASKEVEGYQPIQLYGAQRRALSEIFSGLENDIHWFVILKARQLGISTIVRALIVFWAFMHPGLRVALVYDTDANKEDAREEIKQFLDRLPSSHKIGVTAHPKTHLQLANGSRVSYFVAGIKKSKGSGGLGRSRGINCAGCTEISSWGDIEGLRAFERSLAQQYDNRLFVWESTARGFNVFYDLWEEAKADDLSKKAIFIGWWSKEIYSIPRDSPLFERYGIESPDEEEQRKIDLVRERYAHDVTMEQLAWFRHEFDPDRAGDEDREISGQEIILQELPWVEEDSFLLSGSQFFPADKLTEHMKAARHMTYKGYKYYTGEDFLHTVIEEVRVARMGWLKVWEEPEPGAVYTIGADPAYGSSEESDRHVAQVLRCYADGVDQVAEFASNRIVDYQFCWVIAHLCGAYGSARLLLELNGPGMSVWNEFRMLQHLLSTGYLREAAAEKGLTNIFDNVRQYLWSRQDSLSRNPTAFQWETNIKRKKQIMTRLRDFVHVGQIKIRSEETLKEMQKIVQDGDEIRGEGSSKDDRVMGLALAVRAWEDHERKPLIAQNRTRQFEAKRRDLSVQDLQAMFSTSMVQDFFNRQQRSKLLAKQRARRGSRWTW